MKKSLFIAVLAGSLILSGSAGFAQQKEEKAGHGTWQLVSNINDKTRVTVQFFSKEGSLMYEETLYNVKLDLCKRKTVKRLDAVLAQVHQTWVNARQVTESGLIARKFAP